MLPVHPDAPGAVSLQFCCTFTPQDLLEATQFTEGMNMDKYWRTIVCTDVRDLGCHSECFKCLLENELCSPCRWKAIEETATAKEWVYAVIAAKAITKIGIMEELPPSSDCTPLYSTVVTMQPIQKLSMMTLHAKGGIPR